jgi:Family of unknown function (DUF6448)
MKCRVPRLFPTVALLAAGFCLSARLAAHCDTLAGPVVGAARAALEKRDVTLVLRWVKPEQEQEVRERFARALAVRKLSREARELADTSFFENLVRLHRLGENAPYAGLQSGTRLEPVVAWTDAALNSGSAEAVIDLVTREVASGIRARFEAARENKNHAEDSVTSGREFVKTYVEYTHYVERIYNAALGAEAEEETHSHTH